MNLLEWNKEGERRYQTGVDRVVLYTKSEDTTGIVTKKGTAWEGVMSVTESPEGAEASPYYANNTKYLNIISAEEFKFSIGAYDYPSEFNACEGVKEVAPGVFLEQQDRESFDLSYRTILGNDTKNNSYGYMLHLIYNATASVSEKERATINESTEPAEFDWECTTLPADSINDELRQTAKLKIDSTLCDKTKLAELESILYGTKGDSTLTPPTVDIPARMPTMAEVIAILTGTPVTPFVG